MKKIIYILASVLCLTSCENYFIDKNLSETEWAPTDVRTIDYTLTDADYKAIASNATNIELALKECTKDSLGNVDSTAYFALLQVGKEFAFNKKAIADVYVPAFLAAKYPQLSKGSMFNITYKNAEGAPEYLSTFASTTKYVLSNENYDAIWGEGKTGTYYLTPATIAGLTSVLPTEGVQDGDIMAVVYDYKSQEPIFVTEDEEEFVPGGDPNFFLGTPEERGFYTPTEVIAAYKSGDLGEGDTIKVGGIINKWYKKSSRFDEFLNVSYYIKDNNDSVFEMYNSYSVDRDSFPVYEFVDEYNATCIDASGREFILGDTVIGIGALTYYASYNVYEFKSGCYLLEHRPLKTKASAAPKKAAAANLDGKKTVLYQYNNGRWSAYKNDAATVVALPEDVYTAVGFNYLLEKNKNILTTFLAQEYPYAQAGNAYTVVYVAAVDKDTNVPTYNAIEFVYDGAAFVENIGITFATSTFSLTDIWGSTIYYKQAIAGDGDQGKLVIQDVIKDEPLSYVWQYTNDYGMKATAYVNKINYPSESWVVTPVIDLSRAKNPQLSFDQARRYGVDFIKECFVKVSTDYAGDVTTCTWDSIPFNKNEEGKYIVPDGSSWTFMNTGEMDLSKYVGQKIYIGFKYTSSAEGSATWEFKNLLVSEPAE